MAAIVPASALRAIAENQTKVVQSRAERWQAAGIKTEMSLKLSRRLPKLGMFGGLLEQDRVLRVLAAACREYEETGVQITPEHLTELDRESWSRRGFWHRFWV